VRAPTGGSSSLLLQKPPLTTQGSHFPTFIFAI
jgi:hypothetical protein